MPKASELKNGMVLQVEGAPHIVRRLEARSPSSRGAATLYKVRFTNMLTGLKREESYKGDDYLQEADCLRVRLQLSYVDGNEYVFMNTEDYSQYSLTREALDGQELYLLEGMTGIFGLLVEDHLKAIELPPNVVLRIVDTAPALKGATATGRTKPAKLETGLEIQVPEYLAVDEPVKVNTETGKFVARA